MPGSRQGDEDINPEARSGAEARGQLVRDSPGADSAAAVPPLLHQCSTNGRRSRRQRQLLRAQPNIPCRTPGDPGDRNRDRPHLPLLLLLVQVCSEDLPPGAFLISPLGGEKQCRDSSGSSPCFSVRCLQLNMLRSLALSKGPYHIACTGEPEGLLLALNQKALLRLRNAPSFADGLVLARSGFVSKSAGTGSIKHGEASGSFSLKPHL
ncbi:uncharacterized protein LOC128821474 isoform X1 [Vidua macroura]|uniref:uncharacterized protein LOC128821474 isoform X1 n=1 Tax=Vidua macroura TaxID=187451 RepID=UPI0023A7EC41|nr:uncharacterized protein LOC128821474 isoform X1 [Vidua macroura]